MPSMFASDAKLPVKPDPRDGRDLQFERPEGEVPARVDPDWYQRHADPTWEQRGSECTGFALAALANYLVRSHARDPDAPSVSPRMMYEMAQVYDRAAYEEGSTLRGALKGWKRHGVTTRQMWPYHPDDERGEIHGGLTLARMKDARLRSLGEYRRISVGDRRAMQAAIAGERALYVGARVHAGWYRLFLPMGDPVISRRPDDKLKGGHAFLLVGYDERGFVLHNSWGRQWGDEGYALLPYEDWDANGYDVWVAGYGGPAYSWGTGEVEADARDPAGTFQKMWRHVVPLGDDGRLSSTGLYSSDQNKLDLLLYVFKEQTKSWANRRLAVIADDGSSAPLVTIERLEAVRDRLMAEQIYPIFFVWDVPWYADMNHELWSVLPTSEESEEMKEVSFWLAEYQIPQTAAVHMWRAIRERARRACRREGGARALARAIEDSLERSPFSLHLVAHGAGDFLASNFATILPTPIASCELWAPASSVADFRRSYGPMVEDGRLAHMTLSVLDDESERADRIGGYGESILSLASNVLAVEGIDSDERYHFGPLSEAPPMPEGDEEQIAYVRDRRVDPVPLVGLARFHDREPAIKRLVATGRLDVEVLSGLTHRGLVSHEPLLTQTIKHMSVDAPPRRGTVDPLVWARERSRARRA